MSDLAIKLISENKKTRNLKLDLGHCGLTRLPQELNECIWLETLILSNSWYGTIDYDKNRIDFNYSENSGKHNHITSIEGIENLCNLKELIVSGDDTKWGHSQWQLNDLSPVRELINLKRLECAFTHVSDLTPLANLINLQRLVCCHTEVRDLTPILPLIKNGQDVVWGAPWYSYVNKFYFESYPLNIPPSEIVKRGTKAVLDYFTEREREQFKNTEVKLILIGNSTVGKTSLCRFLRERIFDSDECSTEGIVSNLKWIPDGLGIQVNIWDFGGQEYYHATHRLFLSRNTVYVLVWDAQTNKSGHIKTPIRYAISESTVSLEHFPLRWWVQNIRNFTRENGTIPILLVQNKCARDGVERVSKEFEKPPFNLPPDCLDNHIDLEATNAHYTTPKSETRKWQRNFESFEERLLDTLQSQLVKYEFAIYHRDICDEVRRLSTKGIRFMSYIDFENLCYRIEANAKMDLVLIYLNDITGDILYHPRNKRLQDRVFIHPNWVCSSIYKILNRQVQVQNGIFSVKMVCKALRCDEKEALNFVELMREFELIFDDIDEARQVTGQYVAPQYLPERCTQPGELEGAKKFANLTHVFTLWFPEFLPKSHIARFVAFWGGKAKHRLFWKNGLLFQTEGCTALVERTEENKIRVDLQSNNPKRAEAIRRIFQSFLHLEDGQAGFAVSLDDKDFVWWRDVQEAIHIQGRQVKTYSGTETAKYIELQPFHIFHQPPMLQPKKVFISYSHKDEDAMKELDKFLGPLERKGEITIWTDRKILPGQNWKDAILSNLEDADLTLLLVSANFLDSDFINKEEIPRAFQRMNDHGKHVIPIILNYCLWDMTSLSALQATPKDGRPIADFGNPAQAWSEVARGILGLLNA